ncbi:MAG: HAMP domain-containing histidine kinase [Oligoflexia bacterium]|nr:HAMP domain-containing histidine kinase [Oligoflexia bacterium]
MRWQDDLLNANTAVVICNEAGKITWRNNSAAAWLGARANLAEAIDDASARKLLTPLSYTAIQAHAREAGGTARPFLSVDISGADPSEIRFLILRLNAEIPEHSVEERELALATVAHDLKNPLAAIFGYADALLETGERSGIPAGPLGVIGKMRRTSARAIELVKNYQALALLQYSRVNTKSGNAELNDVTRTAIDSLWRSEVTAPTITQDLAKEPIVIATSRSFLERVVANLLSNALNYATPGSAVTVRTAAQGKFGIFEVHNLGTPISPQELPRIFDAYVRAKSGTNTAGSGLGLHIVKSIVDSIGGTVQVASDVSTGTTFTVRLPIA